MTNGTSGSLSQKTRLVIMLIYVAGLFVASRVGLDTWLPPTTEKGVWFYSASAALLLGNLLVTPFFTKPADALSYAVVSLITLIAVSPWFSTQLTSFDRFIWFLAVAYAVLVLTAALGSIVLGTAKTPFGQRASRSLFILCDSLGAPRAIFSVVFLFALITYHRNDAREYLTIGIAWAIFVGLNPLESVANLVRRWRSIWAGGEKLLRLGEIAGHEAPHIVLVREDTGQEAKFGDVIIAHSDEGRPDYALALDHIGFADGRWLRAIHLSHDAGQPTSPASDRSVLLVSSSATKSGPLHQIFPVRDRLLGLVAPDTTVSRLYIELVRSDPNSGREPLWRSKLDRGKRFIR